MSEHKYTTISIPTPLANRVREFIEETGFASMSDFVTFLLRDVFSGEGGKVKNYEEAREDIRKRLKALGYID